MIFRDLSQDIGRLVKDMREQETSKVRRVEEKTVGNQKESPEIRTEYNLSMRTLPSKEELNEYQNEVRERNGSRNDLIEPRDPNDRE
jgi:NAD(P)H-nitrite reductase large subunit